MVFARWAVKFSQIIRFHKMSRCLVELPIVPQVFWPSEQRDVWDAQRTDLSSRWTIAEMTFKSFTLRFACHLIWENSWIFYINKLHKKNCNLLTVGKVLCQCTIIPSWCVPNWMPARAVNSPVQWPQAIGGSYKTDVDVNEFPRAAEWCNLGIHFGDFQFVRCFWGKISTCTECLDPKFVCRACQNLNDPLSDSCAKEYSDRAAASVISNPIRSGSFSDVWCLAFG